MDFQRLFERFHQTILLTDHDYALVRQVRDRILSEFRSSGSNAWTFQTYNWGSYEMGTGIKPLQDQDYDVDLGLVFNVRPGSVDSQQLKRSVYSTLASAGYNPDWKRPCISLAFNGFHIDMSVCAREGNRLFLAEGKQYDGSARWRPDGMEWFVQLISEHPNRSDSHQFRRIIRYLKRWKDIHFRYDGMKGPVGLALTVMAYRWFNPQPSNDLRALQIVVKQAIEYFDAGYTTLKFPYEPNDDLLRKMSGDQVNQMGRRFDQLSRWLNDAVNYQRTGCLVQAFGDSFPTY